MNRKLLSTAVSAVLAASMPVAFVNAQQNDNPPATQSGEAQSPEAQDESARRIDTVTVTGSLIPQTEIETATPVQSITAEDIKRQGFRDVYDVLRSQPLSTGAVQDSQFTAGFTPNAEPISLLGLDPGFTLVLIDGRPLADYPLLYNGQSNFVDLSSIPTAMVERIDIAPGNQSSIYGSSAIAGVVNIILKKQVDGTTFNFRMGTYDQGGGTNSRFQLTGGKSLGAVNLVYGMQYSRQEPIFGYQREDFDSTNDNPDPTLRFGSRTFIRSRVDGTYVDPGAGTCAGLSGLFGGNTIYDFRPGRGNYCGSRAEPGYTSFKNKQESLAGYLNASYQLNDDAELYGTLLLNRTKTESSSGSRFWQPSIDTSGFIVNANSGEFESYQHIFAPEETGGRDFNNQRDTNDSYNVAVGVRGGFGESAWAYDVFANRSEYRIDSRQQWPLKDKIEQFFRDQFLGPQLGDYYGYPIYAPNDAGFYRALTPAQYRSFNDEIRTKSKTYTQNINLQLTNTELFDLPAGPVGFAAVLQAGQQYWSNPTDQRVVNGQFWGLTGTQGDGKRDNQAVAIEFRVPIFSMLTASASGRYDKYSNKGLNSDKDTTYKLGLEFRPVDSLLFRANYATAFKAPDMAYVFAGNSGFFQFATDYYRCATEEPGVPIDNCSFNQEQIFGNRAGSPDLESITAKSWGYGLVWAPSSRLNISADYYHVEIENKVEDIDVDRLLRTESACRTGQQDPNSPTCTDAIARIGRAGPGAPDPGQLNTVSINPINIASEQISGILSKLSYQLPETSIGTFSLDAQYNVTLDHENVQFPGDPVIDYLREPFYSSEFRNVGSGSITWQANKWTSTLYGVRYGSTPNYIAQLNETGYQTARAGKIGGYTTFNGTLSYDFSDDVSLTFTANNLLDKDPPRDDTYTAYPYFNIFNYNGFGRSFLVELNVKFGGSTRQ